MLALTKPMRAASRSAVRRTIFMIKLLHQLFVLIVADGVILERRVQQFRDRMIFRWSTRVPRVESA